MLRRQMNMTQHGDHVDDRDKGHRIGKLAEVLVRLVRVPVFRCEAETQNQSEDRRARLRNALDQRTGKRARLWEFRKSLEKKMALLGMDKSYADRDLNVGFSGGEKKKAEILQMLMLNPALAILDETDSGLDVDAVRIVSEGVKEFQKNTDGALVIITHSTRILDSLKVDHTHILVDGRIVKTGDGSLVEEINRGGFERFVGGNA